MSELITLPGSQFKKQSLNSDPADFRPIVDSCFHQCGQFRGLHTKCGCFKPGTLVHRMASDPQAILALLAEELATEEPDESLIWWILTGIAAATVALAVANERNIGRTSGNDTTSAAVDDTLLLTTLFARSLVEASLTPIEQVQAGDRVLAESCDNYSQNTHPIHQRFGADHGQNSRIFACNCVTLPPIASAAPTPSGETVRRDFTSRGSLVRSLRAGVESACGTGLLKRTLVSCVSGGQV